MRRVILAACAALFAFSAWAGPVKYYVLAPEHLSGDLPVMSLEAGNVITANTTQLTLQQYETGTIPAADLFPGVVIQGTGAFVVGSTQSAADLLAPDSFAGTAFVVPHISGQHKYFFLSPSGTADVTVQLGANTYNIQAAQGVVNEFDAGSDNAIAGRITSNQPIVLAHVAYVSTVPRDAYPVPPAATEIVGIRSQNAVVATATDGTSVTAYANDGTSATYNINTGQKATIAVGASTNQGQGASLRLVSNYPIAAVQYDDGDGDDMTAFWPSAHFGRRIGVPIGAQYLAVACTQANVSVTLYKGSTNPESQICSGNGNSPGKVYFGASTSGANVGAGWYLISTQPVYVMYEGATPEDEDNNLGLAPPAGPAAPTLNAVSSPTTNNPQTVTGTSGANQSVRLYVNGKLRATATANGSGSFTFNAELIDDNNVLYATAVVSGNESDPSASVSVTYNNTISRTQSGSISTYTVWTPGNPAVPYTITANLTVAAGGKLVLQPGTTLKFANGTLLTATGELKVVGSPGNPVTITSSAASPVRGSWQGVYINGGTPSLIEYAVIEYTSTGVNVAAVTATVRSSTIRYFLNNGVYVSGAGAAGALIQNNLIDNLNDTGDCIETSGSSPTISGNSLTNCLRGIQIIGAAAPIVNGNNLVFGNDYGIHIDGSGGATALPVVTGNQLFANDLDDYRAFGYNTTGSGVKLNATNNWWGTAVPTTISANINDLTDSYTSTTIPTVDYSNYLSAPNGSPVAGNYLIGKLTATSTVLTAGTTYDVLGVLFVNSGKTLTVQPGATVRFHGGAFLVVDGTLTAQGASGNLATLTSGRATPARGDWPGVLLRASGSLIDYSLIAYSATGVKVSAGSATIRNSTIQLFTSGTGSGIYVSGASAGTLIENNIIDNGNDSGRCIWVQSNAPTIQGNTLTNCAQGIYLLNTSSPTINGGNIITGNNDGMYVNGNLNYTPQPVVNGNQIFGNDTNDFYTVNLAVGAQNLKLNATGNWWGTTDPTVIGGNIYDLTDSPTSTRMPTVDYTGFLDGPDGNPVPGSQLIGPFTATNTVLTGGTTYDVLSTLWLPAGKSLTIPAGTTLKFYTSNSQLIVAGSLTIQGASGNLARLTSGRAAPARGDWSGVVIGVSGTIIDFAQIEYASSPIDLTGFSATITNSTIRYFAAGSNGGIYVYGAGASASLIANNWIENGNDSGRCIWVQSSSPTIQGNTIKNCQYGIYLYNTASPTINAGNVVTDNSYGVYVNANGYTPAPLVNANQIHGSANQDYVVSGFASPAQDLKLNATGNWWGTADARAISTEIQDLTDSYASTNTPTVDYSGFLDGPNGSPVPGNQLIGPFSSPSTVLSAGVTYEVLGTLWVRAGKSLTVPAGTTLRFHPSNSRLIVDGTLLVQGTTANRAVFTSGKALPGIADWVGIVIQGGSGTDINGAKVEWIDVGIDVNNVAATIRNSIIRRFPSPFSAGVYIHGSGASASSFVGNVIDNETDNGRCLWIQSSAPLIQGNTITNCNEGIYVHNTASPTINAGNVVTGNGYGIYVYGGNSYTPQPVINGNQIFGNGTYDFQTGGFAAGAQNLKVNATGNWWGTQDPVLISNKIYDLTDTPTATTFPTVDFSGYLDGPGGSAVPGNQLIGPFTAASTVLTAGATYEVLSSLWVQTGKSLTIPAGTTLRFYSDDTKLIVNGTLTIQGTAGNLARLTSGRATPARSDWVGILVNSSATNTLIEYALIEWANRGVEVLNTNATIRNNVIRYFGDDGIRMTGATSASTISGNYIDNYTKIRDGIYLSASSPSISGNRIVRTDKGIFLIGASNPSIVGNILQGNNWGIYMDGNGSNSASAVPNPVITGNDIYGNTNAGIEVYDYGASNPVVINATGNWWGTATPQAGQQIKFTSGSPTTTLNFSGAAAAPLNGASSGDITVSEAEFSPNGDMVKDITVVQGSLNQASSWTVNFRSPAGSIVRSISGSGTTVSVPWDGKNSSGVVQADGAYDCELTVPGSPTPILVAWQRVTLDNTPPSLSIATPPDESVVPGIAAVVVIGTATDLTFQTYLLEQGPGSAPSTWSQIHTQGTIVTSGPLGTWNIWTPNGSAGASGLHTLRLSASDRAGNSGVVTSEVTLDNIVGTGITQSVAQIRPAAGEQVSFNFTMSGPGTATVDIYPDLGGALVRQISQVFGSGGPKSLVWDGKNSSGSYVPDEAYRWVLTLTNATQTSVYDPPDTSSVGSGYGIIDTAFNAHRNDFWKMSYDLANSKARVLMRVSGCGATYYPLDWVPFVSGPSPIIWDGRNPSGALVTGTCSIYFDAPDPLRPFSVIVKGVAPAITGAGASPNIEVKSNPYKAVHSFEQFSRISFRVNQDSYVTVKLLPPGISDPASPAAIVLVNNEFQSAQSGGQPFDRVVEWLGYSPTDTNDIQVSEEGTYTFAIQATSTVTGATTLYRGALQLWQ